MSNLFTLKLRDENSETIDFLSSTVQVQNGGFDIGLPRTQRNVSLIRPGFYQASDIAQEYREAKIKFNILGTTRASILTTIQTIERVLRRVSSRNRVGLGTRAELVYAWEGSTNITYFEVYAGTFNLPGDVLSIEKMLTTVDGKLALVDCEIVFTLSPLGYGISVFSADAADYVPIYNDNTIDPLYPNDVYVSSLGGEVAGYDDCWVEIDARAFSGSHPMILNLRVTMPGSGDIQAIYMGLTRGNFYNPSLILSSSTCLTSWGLTGGIEYADTDCEGDGYRKKVETGRINVQTNPQLAWSVSGVPYGLFYAFLHARDQYASTHAYSLGTYNPNYAGLRYAEDYVSPVAAGRMLPLGVLQNPLASYDIVTKVGNILDPDNRVGLWYVIDDDSGGTVTVDQISLLPIDSGMRILYPNGVGVAGDGMFVDSDWLGHTWYTRQSGLDVYTYTPPYNALDSLRIEPGIIQRIYFQFFGHAAPAQQRAALAKVYASVIPTFSTVAL